jgi:hypothetical protein
MRYVAPILVALVLGAALISPTTAQPFRARQGVQSGEVRSLNEILNGIRRERPGSLADVQGPNAGPEGEPRYRLKWLTPDGRVLWLDTDARTGRVLGVEGDDRAPPGPARGGFFGQRRNYYPDGPPVGPPNGYQRGVPGGLDRGLPPGYNGGPPPRSNGGPRYNGRPPPGYNGGPPPGYNRRSPSSYNPAPRFGPREGSGRFRNGR